MTLYQVQITGTVGVNMGGTQILRTGIIRAVQFAFFALGAGAADAAAAVSIECSKQSLDTSEQSGPLTQTVALSSLAVSQWDHAGTGLVSNQPGGTIVPCAVRVNLGDIVYANGRSLTEIGSPVASGWMLFWVED